MRGPRYVARVLRYRIPWLFRWAAYHGGRLRSTAPTTRKPRVLIWAWALQSDILVLAHALADTGEADLLVVTLDSAPFLDAPIQQLKPLRCPILTQKTVRSAFACGRFRADLVITDGPLPEFPMAPRLLYQWHGLGHWKVKPRAEISMFAELARPHVGDVRSANPHFLVGCYGQRDAAFRQREWGFASECCRLFGMPFSDWLLVPPYTREAARRAIGLRTDGPTVLLCLSWHFGNRFANWGDLADIVSVVAAEMSARNGEVILCMHEPWHYEPDALKRVGDVIAQHANVILRHRNDYPDNLADVLAADFMISNYSSFVTAFYVTGKPTIHIDPRNPDGSMPSIMSWTTGRLAPLHVGPNDVWLNRFDVHGGLLVRQPDELRRAMALALAEPDCCRAQSRRYLEQRVVGMDGRTAPRMAAAILDWIRES